MSRQPKFDLAGRLYLLGVYQYELAGVLRVSANTVQRWCTRTRKPSPRLMRLIRMFLELREREFKEMKTPALRELLVMEAERGVGSEQP